MAFQGLGSSNALGQARMGCPEVPAVEVLLRKSRIVIVLELDKGLLDRPDASDLQGVELERVKVAALALGEVFRVLEPQVLRLRERLLSLSSEFSVVPAAHQSDGFVQFLGTMELLVHDHSLRRGQAGRFHIVLPHAHRTSPDAFPLHLGDRGPEGICGLPGAVGDDIKHPFTRDVVQHREKIMPFAEALFIEPDVRSGDRASNGKSTGDCPLHDAVAPVPGEKSKSLDLELAAAGLRRLDHDGLEELGEAALVLGPGDPHLLHPALRAAHARDVCGVESFPLHRVEMPPAPGGGRNRSPAPQPSSDR